MNARKSPRERDPSPEQRGKRGRRPGGPDLTDFLGSGEAWIGLPADVLVLHVALERVLGALKPAPRRSTNPYGPSVAEWELARQINRLATKRELRRRYSREELAEMAKNIERAVMNVSQKLFEGLGEHGRLWWVHRRVGRTLEYGSRLIGKESLAGYDVGSDFQLQVKAEYQVGANGERWRPMPKWSPKKIRTMAARRVGMKDESALRKLPPDRIGISSVEKRALKRRAPNS